jgi:hypothetical protein
MGLVLEQWVLQGTRTRRDLVCFRNSSDSLSRSVICGECAIGGGERRGRGGVFGHGVEIEVSNVSWLTRAVTE